MRITCVIGPFLPVPPLRGGAVERIQLALCLEFASRGHEVVLISRRFPGLADDEIANGVRHLRIPSSDAPVGRLAYRLLDVIYALRVSRALPPSDVTITNSVSLPLLLPYRRAGAIYVNVGRFPKGQMSLYRRASRLQAVSAAVAAAIVQQSPTVAHLVKVIANPLSQGFVQASPPARRPRAKRILYVGRIAREKGVEFLVGAFASLAAEFPDWCLDVVGPSDAAAGGDGPDYLRELQARATGFSDRIRFVGPIYGEHDLITLMQDSEIFVYPSLADQGESFGLAPLEAMACGCAVVVSDLACFRDFVAPTVNALTFDHRTSPEADLRRILAKLIESDEDRKQLGEAALNTAKDFTPARIADVFLADFTTLLAQPSKARIGQS